MQTPRDGAAELAMHPVYKVPDGGILLPLDADTGRRRVASNEQPKRGVFPAARVALSRARRLGQLQARCRVAMARAISTAA